MHDVHPEKFHPEILADPRFLNRSLVFFTLIEALRTNPVALCIGLSSCISVRTEPVNRFWIGEMDGLNGTRGLLALFGLVGWNRGFSESTSL